ncbi:aminotransferase class I/II-fold pyridoxal phosphate-dependent enzyme [Brevibacillus humidisoli]|uniref:DegT/DnrJ/EryC1/StrS family aminotransferase n=1 Tax=Brevibacillus humidisoli TaxID=2895522 RepID=UPI001E65B284|nr:aminotransferase class I/II-fold pyridoxal phosphate-dependent enzyme [Brevibacillus humidisoli]UFJ42503.1 aminotransferase class I/II-fold pyridoxal phosphate-dependent enzyme [Brevibacillus humidisoli]
MLQLQHERAPVRIYLSPPHLCGREQSLLNEALASNWIAPHGPQIESFERELAGYTGAAGAIALQSGTAAIHLALRLAEVGEGDTVLCSTLTFVASANPILYQRAEPIFVDSEPNSWNMSPAALERALADAVRSGRRPKAVIVVNLYGQSADMDPIQELCTAYRVPLIEDAAESLGATYQGKMSGTLGRYGIYSFNGNKIITTSGGGALVSDDLEALEQARYWATQARLPLPYYQHGELGYNYRMSNLLAAVGRAQLSVVEERILARRKIFGRYQEELSEIPGVDFMPEAAYGRCTRWLSTATIDERLSVKPAELIEALEADNIEARHVWKPLHRQPLFANCPYYPHSERESVSDHLFSSGICLPSGSNLTDDEQTRVIACLKQVLKQRG